ncbi:MAG: HAD family phosphatase [bacterium]|nr:HAD family phosphatase [bacterium]MBU1917938.1 HAD family phosphatase [bacterium]
MIKITPKAFFFDFDGVICDTEKLHMSAIQKVLSEESIFFDENYFFSNLYGQDDKSVFKQLFHCHKQKLTAQRLENILTRKNSLYQKLIETPHLFYPGVQNLINRLTTNNIPLAIVSCARSIEIRNCLKKEDLLTNFKFIVGSDNVTTCKPHPEGYQKAYTLMTKHVLGLPLEDCWVLEDSPTGVKAAKAAGLNTIAITNTTTAENLHAADHIVMNYSDIALSLKP